MQEPKKSTKKKTTKKKVAKKEKIILNPNPKPWEQQVGESMPAFEAFVAYRDMENRSMAKVGKLLGKSRALMEGWSSKWNWVERAKAWDGELDRQAREQQKKDIIAMRKRHAVLASDMIELAKQILRYLPDELEGMEPKDKANALSKVVDVATKLERVSRGDSGDVVEVKDGGESVLQTVQLYIPDNGRDSED